MATIWPYKREECSEIPTLSFNPETKVDPEGEDKFIVIEQAPDLTEFTLSVPLTNKVSNYYGRNKNKVKVDYCAVVVNKETRSRSMQKMTVKGSSVSTPKTTKTGNLKGKVEVEIFAVLAEDTASLTDSYDTPTIKGTILATWPKIFIYLDPPPNRIGDEFPTKWVPFRENKNTRKYTKAIHYVDLDEVKVLINENLPRELKNILQGNEGGDYKALRESFFSPVAVDITEQLARHALNYAKEHDGIDSLEGLYKRVIESICTLLTEIDDYKAAEEELNAIILDEDSYTLDRIISTTLPLACQELMNVSSSLKRHAVQWERNR